MHRQRQVGGRRARAWAPLVPPRHRRRAPSSARSVPSAFPLLSSSVGAIPATEDGGRAASNATTAASAVNLACPRSFWDRLRDFPDHCDGTDSRPPRPAPSHVLRRCFCLHLVSSLPHFQLLSSVEGVEEAVVVQESKSRGGAAPPLPPYPNIGELNLDGKKRRNPDSRQFILGSDKTRREISLSAAPKFATARPKLPRARSLFPPKLPSVDRIDPCS